MSQDRTQAIVDTCMGILDRAGIEPNTDRALQWFLPFELREDLVGEAAHYIGGYRVVTEGLLGESTVVLIETVGEAQVPDPVEWAQVAR